MPKPHVATVTSQSAATATTRARPTRGLARPRAVLRLFRASPEVLRPLSCVRKRHHGATLRYSAASKSACSVALAPRQPSDWSPTGSFMQAPKKKLPPAPAGVKKVLPLLQPRLATSPSRTHSLRASSL